MVLASCDEEVRDAFLPQEAAVLALRAKDGGPLFRTEVLEAVHRVCTAFDDAQTDWTMATKCVTTVPLMETKRGGLPRAVSIHEELPLRSADDGPRFEALVRSLEFGIGDVTDEDGRIAYVHLPLASFGGVDLRALAQTQLAAESAILEGALDEGREEDRERYRALAGEGPSASFVVGMYDAGADGELKSPVHLAALERFQERAEGLKTVVQSFTLVDDLKTVRQGLRGGRADQYLLPKTRSEAAQFMLALSMSPATKYGPRFDARERVALIRVNVTTMTDEQRARLTRKLQVFLSQEMEEGARAFLCGGTGAEPESAQSAAE